MKVLVDTNIIMDVLLKRVPFYKDSFSVFQLSDSGSINGVLASISVTNALTLRWKDFENAI